MPDLKKSSACCIAFSFLFAIPIAAQAQDRHGEMVILLDEKTPINVISDQKHHSLTVELPKTSAQRLSSLENYDENLVRRLVIKDLGPEGCSAHIDLKDENLRANVITVDEPFRVVISIFDYDYKSPVDPSSGLPIISETNARSGQQLSSEAKSPHEKVTEDAPVYQLKTLSEYEKAKEHAEPNKHQLLEPTPEQTFDDHGEVDKILAQTKAGRGPGWENYPIYIYPLLLAPYEGRENPAGWKKKDMAHSLNRAQELAGQALKLFLFGDENRSLLIYQKVLHLDRSLFDQDVVHLWALAEAHFGQDNHLLADGYFEALTNKFPESDLSHFAQLRRIDIKALLGIRQNKREVLKTLSTNLDGLTTPKSNEYLAQKLIRQAYWNDDKESKDQGLPYVDATTREHLIEIYPQVESAKTGFLVASLILRSFLKPSETWTAKTAQFAGEYFKKYTDITGKPFYAILHKEVTSRLSAHIKELAANNKSIEAVEAFQNLGPSLQKVTDDAQVAWAIAESYRLVANPEKAYTHYKKAASAFNSNIDRFKATFWSSVLAARIAARFDKNDPKLASQAEDFNKAALEYDKKIGGLFKLLSNDDKEKLRSSYETYFEDTLKDTALLRGPADIILANWTQALATPITTTNDHADLASMYSPSANTIRLLKSLAGRFLDLGDMDKKRATINLMRKIDIKDMSSDREAQRIWAAQLLSLAEEYREMNQYLEAGRLYAFTASNSVDWEQRAEALYKGGLLLYRAGKREEAVKALTEASQDGNNLFYATLAKERLNQLTKK